MDNLHFEESQQFRGTLMLVLYIILLGTLGMFIYADIQQIILGRPYGEKPAPDAALILMTLFILVLLLLFYFTRLKTTVTKAGVGMKWTPFMKSYKQYNWSDVKEADVFKYGFVGFGLRLTQYGIVYNVGGDTGLRLHLKTGKTIIIGTHKPDALREFLHRISIV